MRRHLAEFPLVAHCRSLLQGQQVSEGLTGEVLRKALLRGALCSLLGLWASQQPEVSVQPVHREDDLASLCTRREVDNWRLIFGTREIVYGNEKPARPPLQERYVEKIITHERYNPRSEINDIALMKITPPVPCGPLIGPGCLPRFRAGPPRVSQACWVAGWGFLKENGEYRRGLPWGDIAGHSLGGLWGEGVTY